MKLAFPDLDSLVFRAEEQNIICDFNFKTNAQMFYEIYSASNNIQFRLERK